MSRIDLQKSEIALQAEYKAVRHYSHETTLGKISELVGITERTTMRIIEKLKEIIPAPYYTTERLGGPGNLVQIDEAMLILYRRATMEVRSGQGTTRAFATIIENKRIETLSPIIPR